MSIDNENGSNTQAIVDTIRESLIILDENMHVISANRSFYLNFKVLKKDIEGKLLYQLGNGQWNIPQLRNLLECTLSEQNFLENIELKQDFPGIGERVLVINARLVKREPGKKITIYLAIDDITSPRQATELLRRSEEKYHKFVEQLNSMILGLNSKGEITFCNSFCEKVFGYSRNQITGQSFIGKIIPLVDSYGKDNHSLSNDLISDPSKCFAIESEGIRRDGTTIWFSWSAKGEYDSNGALKEILIDGNDITELALSRKNLEKKSAMLDSMLQFIPEGLMITDSNHKILAASRFTGELFGVPTEELLQLDERSLTDVLNLYLANGEKLKNSDDLPGTKSLTSGKELSDYVIELRKDGKVLTLSANAAPIHDKEGNIAGAIGSWRDITNQKKMNQQLQSNELRFRNMFQSHAIMLLIDPFTGDIKEANDSAVKFYGFEKSILLNKKIQDLNQFSSEQVNEEMQKALLEQRDYFVFPHRLADGQIRWVEVYSSPINNGEKKLLFSIIHDITERRNTEEALKKSEQRFRGIFNNAAIGILEADKNDQFIAVNDHLCNLLGYSHDELLRLNASQLTFAEDRQITCKINKKIHIGEIDKVTYEKRYLKRDGTPLWVHITVSAIRNTKNQFIGSIGTVDDISKRKKVEQALRESEDKFSKLFYSSPISMTLTSIEDGVFEDVNDAYCRLTEFKREELVGQSSLGLEIITPDIRDNYKNRLKKDNRILQQDIQIRTHNDHVRDLIFSAEILELRGKQFMLVSAVDNTERKKTERALQESQAKLKAAMSSMNDAMLITDQNGRYIDSNDAFLTLHKFNTIEEYEKAFIEGSASLEIYSADGAKVQSDMWTVPRALRGERMANAEYHFYRTDTAESWFGSYSFAPIRDAEQRIIGAVVVGRDITERKRLEEQLSRERKLLQTIIESIPVMITLYDKRIQKIQVNRAFEQITGWTQQDIQSEDLMERVYPDSQYRHMVAEYMKSLAPGFRDLKMTAKNGEIIESSWANVALPDGDQIGIGIDIRERKKTDQELQIAAERFRRVTSSNIIGCVIANFEGSLVFANDYFLHMLDYSRHDFDDGLINLKDITSPEHQTLDFKALNELQSIGSAELYEKQYIRKDGSRVWVMLALTLLPGPEKLIFGFILDISLQRKALEEAQRRRAETESVLDSLPDGYIIYNSDGTIRKINNFAREIIGFTSADEKKMYAERMRKIKAFKIDGGEFPLNEFPSARALRGDTVRGTVMRIQKDGHNYWLSISASPIEVEGKLYGAVMEFSDITDLHSLQEQLANERNFIDTILQTSGALIIVFNKNNQIVRFNKECEKLSGYSFEEVVNRKFYDLLIPEDEKKNLETNLNKLSSGETIVENENHWLTKSGEKRYIRWRNTVLLSDSGKPEFIVATGIDISDRKQVEAALRESEAQFRQLAESLPQLVWVSRPDGYHEYFNKQWYDFTGTVQGETQGEMWSKLLHPDDYQRTMNIWSHSLRTGEPYNIEYRFRRGSDGAYRWFLGRALPVRNKNGEITRWFGTCTDIHSQKQAEEALRKSEERYRLVNRATHDIIWDWDLNTGNLSWNEAIEAVIGKKRSEISQIHSWHEYIHPQDRERVVQSIHRAIDTGENTWSDEYRFGPPGGPYREYLDRGLIAHDTDGKAYRMIGSMLDLTERKRAEQELNRRAEELAYVNKELESFSYSVSHDLRTPLSIIKGIAGFLLEDYSDSLDNEGREYIGKIIMSTDKAQQLIDDILSLSKIGRQEMKFEMVDLTTMVSKYLEELHLTEPQRNVEFRVKQNVHVFADPRLLHIAIENLLRNAWKFTSEKEITIIQFDTILQGDNVVFLIQDNGAGFDMRYAQSIFEPFKRQHAEKRFGGTGIGLSIVQRVINRHGGKVWAEGVVGKGAVFYFTLHQK